MSPGRYLRYRQVEVRKKQDVVAYHSLYVPVEFKLEMSSVLVPIVACNAFITSDGANKILIPKVPLHINGI